MLATPNLEKSCGRELANDWKYLERMNRLDEHILKVLTRRYAGLFRFLFHSAQKYAGYKQQANLSHHPRQMPWLGWVDRMIARFIAQQDVMWLHSRLSPVKLMECLLSPVTCLITAEVIMLDRALHPAKCMLLPTYRVLLQHCTRMVPSGNRIANKHTSPASTCAKDNSDRTTYPQFLHLSCVRRWAGRARVLCWIRAQDHLENKETEVQFSFIEITRPIETPIVV